MRARTAAAAAVALLGLAGCAAGEASAIPAGPVTIEFATQGLGEEGSATDRAIAAFERADPQIHVNVLTLSPDTNVAYGQLTDRLRQDGPTPDVLTLDVIWPAALAQAGWIAPLDRFGVHRSAFYPAQVQAGTYAGHLYAVPWFINAEGLYYRSDLVPQPPSTPDALVAAAQAALRADPSLTSGLAFEGRDYEGLVTVFIDFAGGLDVRHVDSPQNVRALTAMRDAIASDGISPPDVVNWEEPDVEAAYLSGHAAFAINWPYLFALAEAPGSSVEGRTAWVPFPSASGAPRAALGGAMLGINARSTHQDAAWELVRYLLRDDVQIDRAATAGDPPAVRSAYGQRLFDLAPQFRDEQRVIGVATARPADPHYLSVSVVLQAQLRAALSGQVTPEAALAAAQAQVNAILRSG